MLIILFLTLYCFADYILSKQLFSIKSENENISFEFLFLIKKTIICDRSDVLVLVVREVFFRGGKVETFKIVCKKNNSKVAQVSNKQFSSIEDLKVFKDFFNLK